MGERLVTAPGEWRRLSATVWGGFSTVTLEDETAAGGGNDFAIDAVSIVALDGSVAEGCF